MNKRLVTNYIGYILLVEGIFMIPSLAIAWIYQETRAAAAFLITIGITLLGGTMMALLKTHDRTFYAREGFITVALSWIVMSLAGSLPFFFSGAIPSYIDCLFETISGFTTTGASILNDVEILPKSVAYWRSFTHWLGGMGVLVFMMAIVPMGRGNGGSMYILRAESPGPAVGKLVPRMKDTARLLYIMYVVLTVVEMILLLCGGMSLFEAITISYGTAGTGGFALTNASIGAYNSYYIQTVIAVFMLLFGVNFNVYYMLLIRDFRHAFRNTELRVYLSIVFLSTAAITVNTLNIFGNARDALHHSFFAVSSIITTTGYCTADFNLWPEFSRCLLVLLMFLGACAGSTGGGIKFARLLILVKSIRIEIRRMIQPRNVKVMKIDGKTVEDETVRGVYVYITAYLILLALSILVVALDNFSFETTFTSVVSCLNNIGPGLGMVGPTGNFSAFSVLSKLVLAADMLLGRLELFPMLLLFAPAIWRRNR